MTMLVGLWFARPSDRERLELQAKVQDLRRTKPKFSVEDLVAVAGDEACTEALPWCQKIYAATEFAARLVTNEP